MLRMFELECMHVVAWICYCILNIQMTTLTVMKSLVHYQDRKGDEIFSKLRSFGEIEIVVAVVVVDSHGQTATYSQDETSSKSKQSV